MIYTSQTDRFTLTIDTDNKTLKIEAENKVNPFWIHREIYLLWNNNLSEMAGQRYPEFHVVNYSRASEDESIYVLNDGWTLLDDSADYVWGVNLTGGFMLKHLFPEAYA